MSNEIPTNVTNQSESLSVSTKQVSKVETVKEVVLKHVKVDDKGVSRAEDLSTEILSKKAVDQEADMSVSADQEWSDYDPENATGEEAESEDHSEDLESLITHCDAYKIGGTVYPVIVAKNLTDVLSHLKNGSYTIATFTVNYKRTAAISIEGTDKLIEREPLEMPRGKKGTTIENNLVVVELNSINGFKVSVLYDEVKDDLHQEMQKILKDFSVLQGNELGDALSFLGKISQEMTVANQASLGLAKQARSNYISRSLDKAEQAGGKRVITKEIQKSSADLANKVNEALGVKPLTDYSISAGIRLQYVTRTETEPKDWESRRSTISYKKTKSGYIRIERIADNVITVPFLQEHNTALVADLEKLAGRFLVVAEKIARFQVGIDIISDLPKAPTMDLKSKYKDKKASEVLGMTPVDYLKVASEKSAIAQKIVDDTFKEEKISTIASLLSTLTSQHKDN